MKKNKTSWYGIVCILPFFAFATEPNGGDTSDLDPPAATVRIAVYDDTERNRLPPRAEIWIRGLGSWWIARENVKNISDREIGAPYTMHIYPDGRSGKELSVEFQLTADMCQQGCARDLISVAISDAKVTVFGTPIRAATGQLEVEMNRR